MRVEVIYAEPHRVIRAVFCADGPATVADAMVWAAADPVFADVDLVGAAVGIFGKVVPRDQPLTDGDRVEVYRALAEDPKKARRARVREARKRR